MIRVTTKDNEIYMYETVIKKAECIFCINNIPNEPTRIHLIENVKVEKQVKYLTLEECSKLGFNVIHTYDNDTTFYKTKNGKVYKNDEYIDITSIIKGE